MLFGIMLFSFQVALYILFSKVYDLTIVHWALYTAFSVGFGLALAKLSLWVLRYPERCPWVLCTLLFPVGSSNDEGDPRGAFGSDGAPLLLIWWSGITAENLTEHTYEAREARLKYVLGTMMIWPLRVLNAIIMGSIALLLHPRGLLPRLFSPIYRRLIKCDTLAGT